MSMTAPAGTFGQKSAGGRARAADLQAFLQAAGERPGCARTAVTVAVRKLDPWVL